MLTKVHLVNISLCLNQAKMVQKTRQEQKVSRTTSTWVKQPYQGHTDNTYDPNLQKEKKL